MTSWSPRTTLRVYFQSHTYRCETLKTPSGGRKEAWKLPTCQAGCIVRQSVLLPLPLSAHRRAEALEKLAHAAGTSKGKDFISYLEKAISIYEDLGDRVRTGAVHLQAARLSMTGASMEKFAHFHALKAVALLEPEGDRAQLAGAYVQAGQVGAHTAGQSVSDAIELMEKGLAMAERLGYEAEATTATTYLAHALVYHAGEIVRGLELHHRGWERGKESSDLLVSASCQRSSAVAIIASECSTSATRPRQSSPFDRISWTRPR